MPRSGLSGAFPRLDVEQLSAIGAPAATHGSGASGNSARSCAVSAERSAVNQRKTAGRGGPPARSRNGSLVERLHAYFSTWTEPFVEITCAPAGIRTGALRS